MPQPASQQPPVFTLTIIAQDPSVERLLIKNEQRKILTARVRVPGEWLESGPRGHRFHVVDNDETASVFEKPVVLMRPMEGPGWPDCKDLLDNAPDDTLVNDARVRAVNAFVIAARTLATFESALGRRVPWGFDNHQIFVVPHALEMENAYYSDEDEGLYFGYFTRDDGQTVQTCLSHDIIAHETTHAIIDGLRPRFLQPGLPDQLAFHEGFADIVALLSVFSIPEVINEAIARAEQAGRLSADREMEETRRITVRTYKDSMLFTLGEQWPGDDTYGQPVLGLRSSVFLKPGTAWRRKPEYEEPHLRGEVLVAAVMQTLLSIWLDRMRLLAEDGRPAQQLVAEEGAKSAAHLLRMVIRAIDYMPPCELELEDVLDAALTSDTVVAPVDDHGYRASLRKTFASFGIRPPARSGSASPDVAAVYDNVNYTLLRSDPDEAFRFLWNNAPLFGIDRAFDTRIDHVVPCVRTGPDGIVVQETAVTYVQSVEGTAAELARVLGKPLQLSVDVPARDQLEIWGAGTLIFDQFGRVRHHASKPLRDWDRQNRTIDYILRTAGEETEARSRRVALHTPGAVRSRAEW